MTRALFALGIAVTAHAVVLGAEGCAGSRETIAEATYLGQHLQCVDKYETRAEIDACRREVRRKWGIVEVRGDAGE